MDGDFPEANWTIPDSFGLVPADTGQRLLGGNPGAYRQAGLFVGQDLPYAANLNSSFVYVPATQGAITGITYNIDLETTNAEGGTYFPLISQSGLLYYDPFEFANATSNTWLNHNFVLDLSHFAPLHGGPSSPNFTTGSTITFGYLATAGGGGFFESITGIDNDPITLTTAPASTPEPSSGLLICAGALALFTTLRMKLRR